jgi:hypothetical protein
MSRQDSGLISVSSPGDQTFPRWYALPLQDRTLQEIVALRKPQSPLLSSIGRTMSTKRHVLLAGLFVLASSSLAAPVGGPERAVATAPALKSFAIDPAMPPSSDPFYSAPDSLDLYQAGAIVRSRPVNTSFATVTAASAQIFYRTTDALGNASATVTTLFAPKQPVSPPQIMMLMGKQDGGSCLRCRGLGGSSLIARSLKRSTHRLGKSGLSDRLRPPERFAKQGDHVAPVRRRRHRSRPVERLVCFCTRS